MPQLVSIKLLVQIGNPDRDSPVLVTCNFYITVRRMMRLLRGLDLWLLVADSKGVNVWCAAGAEEFNTGEATREEVAIDDHSRLVYSEILADERGVTAAAFWRRARAFFAEAGLEVAAVLSDNGPCYIARELGQWLEGQGMGHTRGKPYHPMTQGKIERWHRSMKNVVKLDTYYYPWELEHSIAGFVAYYNNERYHESLDNLRPTDVYLGRRERILKRREEVKRTTLLARKEENLAITVDMWNTVGQTLP